MPTVHLYFRTQLTGDYSTVFAIAEAAHALSAAISGAGGVPGSVTVVEDAAPVAEPEPEPAPIPPEGTA